MSERHFLPSFHQIFHDHVAAWGLRPFDREDDYYAWQRTILSPKQISTLQQLLARRHHNPDPEADISFYDFIASPELIPVLYSERYHYFQAVGFQVATHLPTVKRVLDFGCGIGILTTLFAKVFPHVHFLGVDRSESSIRTAQAQASRMGLENVHFQCLTASNQKPPGVFDTIIATQALFQSESHPGLPSYSWKTFDRVKDPVMQRDCERQVGLGDRIEFLLLCGGPGCRFLFFEKAGHLGRRILLQRALASRGLYPVEVPLWLTYESLGDALQDGPFYVLSRDRYGRPEFWNEEIEKPKDQSLYACQGSNVSKILTRFPQRHVLHRYATHDQARTLVEVEKGRVNGRLVYGTLVAKPGFQGLLVGGPEDSPIIDEILQRYMHQAAEHQPAPQYLAKTWPGSRLNAEEDVPLYENHTPMAQFVWEELPQKIIRQSRTFEAPDGRQRYIELGGSSGLAYLYWANTFDQRQLVIMEESRGSLLQDYFRESLQEN